MIKLSPINQKRWARFKANRLGFSCFIIFILLTLFCFSAELFFNDKALMVSYKGQTYFPVFSKHVTAKTFDLEGDNAPDYLSLQKQFSESGDGTVIMPFVPYGKNTVDQIDQAPADARIAILDAEFREKFAQLETQSLSPAAKKEELAKLRIAETRAKGDVEKLKYHPLPPSSTHYFGTDVNGRDIFAQIVYGYRVAIFFALALLVINYSIGVTIGCMMGYIGGWFDLIFQRLIEILSNVPFLYVIIIVAAVLRENGKDMGFWTLVGIYVFFGWMGMTWYMRTTTFKEKSRDYITAAKAIGAGNARIIFTHLLPNVVSLLVTFIPFSVSGAIVGLTSLDYLGYGLPKDWPSWGRLISMGTKDMNSYWIVLSVVCAMVTVLFLINSIGEAIREAFDPKKISSYE